jgi:hypothetical protein
VRHRTPVLSFKNLFLSVFVFFVTCHSQTRARAHTHSLPLPPSLPPSLSLSLSLSLSHTVHAGCIYLEVSMKAAQVVKIGHTNKYKNSRDAIGNLAAYRRADSTLFVRLIPVSVMHICVRCVSIACMHACMHASACGWPSVCLRCVCVCACVCVCRVMSCVFTHLSGFGGLVNTHRCQNRSRI